MTEYREQCYKMLSDLLDDDIAVIIEKELYNYVKDIAIENGYDKWGDDFKRNYITKSRVLLTNIDNKSHVGNKNLKKKILKGSIEPKQLVRMENIELFPEKWIDLLKLQVDKENIVNKYKSSNVGGIKCKACGNTNVFINVVQTRSADESATIFCSCIDCGKKWSMG